MLRPITNNIIMEELPNIPDKPQMDKGGKLWKTLLLTFLGTTLSIILTFGTSQLVSQHRRAQERHLTALMVMGSIEKFAQNLEQNANNLAWHDTLATYLLNIPIDSLDSPQYDSIGKYLSLLLAFNTLSHDRSAESIFSNSIETWKNLGNFSFIENVGHCFAHINLIEERYAKFFTDENDEIENRIRMNPEAYPGRTLASKFMHDAQFRKYLSRIHGQMSQCHYYVAFIRQENAVNMRLMNIQEKDVKDFIDKNAQGIKADEVVQTDFYTPHINPNSLPALEEWIKK